MRKQLAVLCLAFALIIGTGGSAGAAYQSTLQTTEWSIRWSVLGIVASTDGINTADTGIGRDSAGLTPEQIEQLVEAADLVARMASRLGVPLP